MIQDNGQLSAKPPLLLINKKPFTFSIFMVFLQGLGLSQRPVSGIVQHRRYHQAKDRSMAFFILDLWFHAIEISTSIFKTANMNIPFVIFLVNRSRPHCQAAIWAF